jgi:predicted dienelactone hydrolase
VWALGLLCAAGLLGAGPAQGASGGGGLGTARGSQPFAVGEIVLTYKDTRRGRTLTTVIRYPAVGDPSRVDVLSARPARTAGPFPLIVFAHGYDITPTPYAPLLRAWVRAGYVVAAPIFPYTNPGAPGGPNESDLVNQPGDMSFVISRMLAGDARRHGILSGLLDRKQIAVTGQSDGGSTALAAAYNLHYADHRIRAAMILSGAFISGVDGYNFPAGSPPLLAAQGTADTTNDPANTYHFFGAARPPKFLLSLLGAPHLGPYTDQQPYLGIVERETIAFLDRYLKHQPGAKSRMWKYGNVPHQATLST